MDALDALNDSRLMPFLTALRRWNRTGDAGAAQEVLTLWETPLARELLLAPTPL
jgi:acyl-homoserine lactone acylase PvdQ